MGCIGISGGYHLVHWDEIKLDGNSKGFFEAVTEYFTSHKCGWLGHIEIFLVLCLLAIN